MRRSACRGSRSRRTRNGTLIGTWPRGLALLGRHQITQICRRRPATSVARTLLGMDRFATSQHRYEIDRSDESESRHASRFRCGTTPRIGWRRSGRRTSSPPQGWPTMRPRDRPEPTPLPVPNTGGPAAIGLGLVDLGKPGRQHPALRDQFLGYAEIAFRPLTRAAPGSEPLHERRGVAASLLTIDPSLA